MGCLPLAARLRDGQADKGALCCTEKDAEAVVETSDKRATGHLAAVHIVTEEEAASGAFAIDDVVLPLPGSCITYPRHSTAQV